LAFGRAQAALKEWGMGLRFNPLPMADDKDRLKKWDMHNIE